MALLFLFLTRMSMFIITCTSQRTVAVDICCRRYFSSLPFSDLQVLNNDCTIQQFKLMSDINSIHR